MTRRGRSPAARDLEVANLVDWFGTGLWFTVVTPYLRRRTGLDAGEVALWLGVLGVVGLALVIPGSRIAARRGGRRIAVALHVTRALLFLPLLLAPSAAVLLASAVAVLALDRTASGVLQVLVGQELGHDERVRVMARLHAVANIGIAAGSAVGGLALQGASEDRMALVLGVDAVTFLLAAALLARRWSPARGAPPAPVAPDDDAAPPPPERSPVGAPALPRLPPLVVLAGANCVLALHIPLLNVVMPLLVDDHAELPPSLIGAAFVLNTLLVVLLQVPLSRRASTLAAGGRRLQWAAACLAASALGLGVVGSDASVVAALAAGTVAVVLITLGEIWRTGGAWTVSYAIDEAAGGDGRAIGAFALGPAVAGLVGPALVGPLIISGGAPGALALAVLILGAGLVFTARRPSLAPVAGT